MAPSAGSLHSLLAKNAKLIRLALKNAKKAVQANIQSATRPAQAELQPAYARNPHKQPLHPAAYLRQSQGRWYTTHSSINASKRQFSSLATGGKQRISRAELPKSRVGAAVNAFTGRAPFASTLRPNLTGGTLSRTAGGYGLGSGRVGGARFFSHTPAAPAHVVQNVSQAIRAFAMGGQKVKFDGIDARTGEKKFKTVTALQDKIERKTNSIPKATPGSYVDFQVNPTITALTPLNAVTGYKKSVHKQETLNTEGLLDVLSVDFSRALQDLAIILTDLSKLSALGDLPITYRSSYLRVHFPGCDADTVERLCDELGVRRGIIGQDEDFDTFVGTEIALLFPFASTKSVSECSLYEKSACQGAHDWRDMTDSDWGAPMFSTQSNSGHSLDEFLENPWISSPEGYGSDSLHSSEIESASPSFEQPEPNSPLEYQGIEGIYRFIEQCDAAAPRQ